MTLEPAAAETLEALAGMGWEEAEVFAKRGRSRSFQVASGQETSILRHEEGWAARAGDRRRSLFYGATGAPDPSAPWPEGDGQGLRLPSARPVPRWSPPSSLDAPLLAEGEARGLFEGLARALDTELPGARILQGHLEDGSSESWLLSTRDIAATVRQRAATLFIEAAQMRPTPRRVSMTLLERDARRFSPAAIARRLADHLLIAHRGSAPRRDRGEFLLAPEVVIDLLSALSFLWIGPRATEAAAELEDRRGRLASSPFTLVDDGRLPGGLMEAPVDGEGQPTRRVVLVSDGSYQQPLLAWWQAPSGPQQLSGCSLRASWRDLPVPGPTHLYLEPDDSISVVSLLESMRRGYYLLATEGGVKIEAGRVAVPVRGFAIDDGRPTGSVTGAWLTASIPTLLTGILGTARDLTFQMRGSGIWGAPTLLIRGLELRHHPGPGRPPSE